MSAIALPDFERDIRAALARVLRGESLVVVDGGQDIARISPAHSPESPTNESSSLVDFFLHSPLRDSGISLDRAASDERTTVEF